jgi:hypothetical protein
MRDSVRDAVRRGLAGFVQFDQSIDASTDPATVIGVDTGATSVNPRRVTPIAPRSPGDRAADPDP